MLVKTEGIEPSKLNCQKFEVRCEHAETEMFEAILKLADPLNYIREVLPIMYGNLLIVYGDTNQAKKYFATVICFELYSELYGEMIIPNT